MVVRPDQLPQARRLLSGEKATEATPRRSRAIQVGLRVGTSYTSTAPGKSGPPKPAARWRPSPEKTTLYRSSAGANSLSASPAGRLGSAHGPAAAGGAAAGAGARGGRRGPTPGAPG